MNNLTLLVLTHKNSDTIYKTINSFRDNISNNCKIVIGYDNRGDDLYLKELNEHGKKNNITFYSGNYLNISGNIFNTIKHINSKYIFILEHDWTFNRNIDIDKIIQMMDKNEEINYIRFNKRNNVINAPFDEPLEEVIIDNIKLLKVWSYSGNPHIVRNTFLNNKVLPVMKLSKWVNHHKRGMEAPMTELIKFKLKKFGKDKSHKMFRTYIYGGFNEPAFVVHIG